MKSRICDTDVILIQADGFVQRRRRFDKALPKLLSAHERDEPISNSRHAFRGYTVRLWLPPVLVWGLGFRLFSDLRVRGCCMIPFPPTTSARLQGKMLRRALSVALVFGWSHCGPRQPSKGLSASRWIGFCVRLRSITVNRFSPRTGRRWFEGAWGRPRIYP